MFNLYVLCELHRFAVSDVPQLTFNGCEHHLEASLVDDGPVLHTDHRVRQILVTRPVVALTLFTPEGLDDNVADRLVVSLLELVN
jgi:hypothetical protein